MESQSKPPHPKLDRHFQGTQINFQKAPQPQHRSSNQHGQEKEPKTESVLPGFQHTYTCQEDGTTQIRGDKSPVIRTLPAVTHMPLYLVVHFYHF